MATRAASTLHRHLGEPTAEKASPTDKMRIITYNMLAPCYFRREGVTRAKRVEACFKHLYTSRIAQQLSLLKELDADVICLQEFWFKPEVLGMVRRILGSHYLFCGLQRSRHKEDGLVTLVKKGKWSVKQTHEVLFMDANDRGLLLTLLEEDSGDDAFSRDFSSLLIRHSGSLPATTAKKQVIVANTHLTYPTDDIDSALRAQQAARVVKEIENFATSVAGTAKTRKVISALHTASMLLDEKSEDVTSETVEVDVSDCNVPTILAGDFNHNCDEAIETILKAGYLSAHKQRHGRDPGITHIDHSGKMAGVDFVFTRGVSFVAAAHVLPIDVPDSTEMQRPVVRVSESDIHKEHKEGEGVEPVSPIAAADPVAMTELSWDDWLQLSDHRMVMADVRLP